MMSNQSFWSATEPSQYHTEITQKVAHTLFTDATDGMALLDHNAHFLEVNASFASIFGRDRASLIGSSYLTLLQECTDSASPHQPDTLQKTLQLQSTLPHARLEISVPGKPALLEISMTPVTAEESIFLLQVRDNSQQVLRLKNNVLSMIAHELRSPLNSINGYLELALTGMGGDLNQQQRDFVRRARMGSEHLYALLEDLLVMSRIDTGQFRLHQEHIQLPPIIAQAVEELELTAADYEIAIELDIADAFPTLYADALRLQQALRNLLNNAIRFTSPGGQVTIRATLKRQDTSMIALLQVCDTGIGIASEYQERIFERFFQVPKEQTQRVGGQGLGLTIARKLIEFHGGTITVESIPEQGSTFTCQLPCE